MLLSSTALAAALLTTQGPSELASASTEALQMSRCLALIPYVASEPMPDLVASMMRGADQRYRLTLPDYLARVAETADGPVAEFQLEQSHDYWAALLMTGAGAEAVRIIDATLAERGESSPEERLAVAQAVYAHFDCENAPTE